MPIFSTLVPRRESGDVARIVGPRRASRRKALEAMGLLFGVATILLGVVLTVGPSVPIGR